MCVCVCACVCVCVCARVCVMGTYGPGPCPARCRQEGTPRVHGGPRAWRVGHATTPAIPWYGTTVSHLGVRGVARGGIVPSGGYGPCKGGKGVNEGAKLRCRGSEVATTALGGSVQRPQGGWGDVVHAGYHGTRGEGGRMGGGRGLRGAPQQKIQD